VTVRKEFKELLRSVEEQGGTLKATKMGFQVLAPNGKDIVTVHGTPGDWRAFANVVSELRKAGFTWKGR
jgi:hypothetical protein